MTIMPHHSLLDWTCYAYLLLPIFLFALGWLVWPASLLIMIVFAWLAWRNGILRGFSRWNLRPLKRQTLTGGITLGLWVLLSGIGGYAFQNTDFHIRNAIFHDLIDYPWPVFYPGSQGKSASALVYYIGFWLPAALAGKIAGWTVANAVEFLWAAGGVFLVALQVRRFLKSSLSAAALLMIFFSGMDLLGILILSALNSHAFPVLWPPCQHLEWWLPDLQFSSLTTQLFWVFNQAIPAWLCTILIVKGTRKPFLFLVWSLCFFYAPIPSIGLAPLVGYAMIAGEPGISPGAGEGWRGKGSLRLAAIFRNIRACFSWENAAGGGSIFLITFAYFFTNKTAQEYSNNLSTSFSPFTYLLFIFVEGGLLWLLLYGSHRRDPRFFLAGAMLLIFPFLRVGLGGDFTMRATIPSLFFLMLACGERLKQKWDWVSITITACLLVGSITSLFEINRSIMMTVQAYRSDVFRLTIKDTGEGHTALMADDEKTLAGKSEYTYFLADPSRSPFFRILARPNPNR